MFALLAAPLLLPGCVLLTPEDRAQWAADHAESADVRVPPDYTAPFGIEMVGVPAGSFSMGSGPGDPDEAYLDHEVALTRSFWMAQHELSQTEWAVVAGDADPTPAEHADCGDCPVEQVSWWDAAWYANAASAAQELDVCYLVDGSDVDARWVADIAGCPGYRLPTEGEWEYAARAGQDTAYAGGDDVAAVAWTADNSAGTTQSGCTAASPMNAWGFCDLSGNVWEWTHDWYDPTYYAVSPAADPSGPSTGTERVGRSGGWSGTAAEARLAARTSGDPLYQDGSLGFRLVRTAP